MTLFKHCHKPALALVLVAIVVLFPMAQAGNYETGVAAYKQKNYTSALKYLTAAAKENPGNADAIFYMGLTQVKTGNLQGARQSFEMVTQMLPADNPTAAKARNNISFITQNQIANTSTSTKAQTIVQKAHSRYSKPNYLTHVLHNGAVIHFDVAKMPLKVYMENGNGIQGWTAEHNNTVLRAMQSWQSASRGRIRFTRVSTPNNADIMVRWQRDFAHDNYLGVSPYKSYGNIIVQSDVNLAVYYPKSATPMSLTDISTTALHEFGHALGLKGHSPYPTDVMYFSSNEFERTALSERDINTMQMLYSTEADVQNASNMSVAQSKKYFETFNKAREAEQAGQFAQATQYYRSAISLNSRQYEPKYLLGILLTNQGVKDINSKNTTMARRNFQDAILMFKDMANTPGAPVDEAKRCQQLAEKNLAILNTQ